MFLTNVFQKRKIIRIYIAIVLRPILEKFQTIIANLSRCTTNRNKMRISREGKESITFVNVIRNTKDHSIVNCCLRSGRMHQIRVHMRSIGHPVLGDKLYGIQSNIINRQALHAYCLKINSEKLGSITCISKIHKDISQAIDQL